MRNHDCHGALLQSAEVKMLIICCYYIVLGLGISLTFSISSTYLTSLQNELQDYFECEECGIDSGQTCDRGQYERFTNPALKTIAYSLFALYPVVTLIYVVQFSAVAKHIKRMCGRRRLSKFNSLPKSLRDKLIETHDSNTYNQY